MTLIDKIIKDYGLPKLKSEGSCNITNTSLPFSCSFTGKDRHGPVVVTFISKNVKDDGINVKITLGNGRSYKEHYSYEDAIKQYSTKHNYVYTKQFSSSKYSYLDGLYYTSHKDFPGKPEPMLHADGKFYCLTSEGHGKLGDYYEESDIDISTAVPYSTFSRLVDELKGNIKNF